MEMGERYAEHFDHQSAPGNFTGSGEGTSAVRWGDRFFGQEEFGLPRWSGGEYAHIAWGEANPLRAPAAKIQRSTLPRLSCCEPLEVPATWHHTHGCLGVCGSPWRIATGQPCGGSTEAACGHGVSGNAAKSTEAFVRGAEDAGQEQQETSFGWSSSGTFALWMLQIWRSRDKPARGNWMTFFNSSKKSVAVTDPSSTCRYKLSESFLSQLVMQCDAIVAQIRREVELRESCEGATGVCTMGPLYNIVQHCTTLYNIVQPCLSIFINFWVIFESLCSHGSPGSAPQTGHGQALHGPHLHFRQLSIFAGEASWRLAWMYSEIHPRYNESCWVVLPVIWTRDFYRFLR